MAERRPTARGANTDSRRHALAGPAAAATGALIAAGVAARLLRPRRRPPPPAPVDERAYFSAAELERAAEFRRGQRLLGLAALAVEGGTLTTLAVWRPTPLRRALRRASDRPIRAAAATGAGIALTLAAAGLPLGAIGHRRARAIGLSTQTLPAWLADRGRSAGVAAVLAGLGGAGTVAVARRLERRFWIGGAALGVGASTAFAWAAPALLAPIFNRFEPLPDGPVRSAVLGLADRAGVSVGQVYRVDASRRSTALNAYVDGIGSTRRIVLYDNALRELAPDELSSVVAHELAHVKGRDVLRGLAFLALSAPLGALFVQLSAEAMAARSGDDIRTPAGLPALALSAAGAALLLGPPGNRLSRAIESRADAFALDLTGRPPAFVELQRSLAVTNVAEPRPPRILQLLFGTHPTTVERIGAALAWEERG